MQRSIRILVLAGAPLLALGLFFLSLDAALLCYDECPPESALAATIAARMADGAPFALLSALPESLAWILCLVALARRRSWGALTALALALPCVAAVAFVVFYSGTRGHLLPSTWLQHNEGWDDAFTSSLALLLLWPVATFVATFGLRRR